MKHLAWQALFLAIVTLFSVSCAGIEDSKVNQNLQASIASTQLRLEDRNGLCGLVARTAKGPDIRLGLSVPWPCNFHLDMSGNLRAIHKAGFAYALIESSKRMPTPSRDCETYIQSLRVKVSHVEISQHHDRVASCPPFQWDSVMFMELFD